MLEHVFSLSGREKIVQNQVGFGEVKTNLEQQSRLLHERMRDLVDYLKQK